MAVVYPADAIVVSESDIHDALMLSEKQAADIRMAKAMAEDILEDMEEDNA